MEALSLIYPEFFKYQELIMAPITYVTATPDIYHDTFILQLDGSSDVVYHDTFILRLFQNAHIFTIHHYYFYYELEWFFS